MYSQVHCIIFLFLLIYFLVVWSLGDFSVDPDAVHFLDLRLQSLRHQSVLLDRAQAAELAGLH